MKLIYDLHTHTIFSHGTGTIEDNVRIAKEKGLKEIGITDHGFEHGLYAVNRKKLPQMRIECDRLSKKYNLKVLLGIEADIIDYNGNIDVNENDKSFLDFVIVGYHKVLKPRWRVFWFSLFTKIIKTKKQREKLTDSYIKALDKHNIKFFTHLNRAVKVNVKRIADECKKRDMPIELNGKGIYFSQEEIEYMKKNGNKFICGSDAHSPEKVGETNRGFNFIVKNNIDIKNVVNCE